MACDRDRERERERGGQTEKTREGGRDSQGECAWAYCVIVFLCIFLALPPFVPIDWRHWS